MAGTGKAHLRADGDVVLRVEDLVVEFPVGRTGLEGQRRVAASASTCCAARRSGSSASRGCGKTTTGRAIMQLPRPTSGSVMFEGSELTDAVGRRRCARRARGCR